MERDTTWTTLLDRSLLVAEGLVACPRSGRDEQVERCLACPHLLGLEATPTRVVCAWPLDVAGAVARELALGRRWER